MIVITGATGTIGSEVVRLLTERGVKVRAVTRDPERARLPAEVEVVRGDYTDAASMAAAFDGAEAAFLVGLLGPDYVELDRALVATARAAGVRRLVKLSAIGAYDPELGRVGTWHLPGEQAVRESGVAWTILRPSSFASNTLSWAAMLGAGQPGAEYDRNRRAGRGRSARCLRGRGGGAAVGGARRAGVHPHRPRGHEHP